MITRLRIAFHILLTGHTVLPTSPPLIDLSGRVLVLHRCYGHTKAGRCYRSWMEPVG